MYNAMNFDYKNSDVQNTTISMIGDRHATSARATRPRRQTRATATARTSYGNVVGDWYVWEELGQINRVAFSPNVSKRLAQFTDGLSNTMIFSESQIGHYEFRTCSSLGGMTYNSYPDVPGTPAMIASIAPSCSTGDSGPRGHVTWTNGSVFNSGVTTADTPNSQGHPPRLRQLLLGPGDDRRGPGRAGLRLPRRRQLPPRRRQRADGRRLGPVHQGQRSTARPGAPWARSPAAR